MRKVMIYKRFERFWHWMQALLIFILMLSGFEVHSTFSLFGYEKAFIIHNFAAWFLIILTAFSIFWHFTTGEWRQYIPTTKFLKEMVIFYTKGIFNGEPHPVKKTELSKLNPLQRLTYLLLKVVILPLQIFSGLVYFFYNELPAVGFYPSLDTVATLHTVMTFMLVAFVIAHIYLTTTGHTVFANIKAMITGWEELD
jgi:thiosulfate reductase cytochrome b subunit